jgi:membrane protease YdiL (CAAX protease family)
MQRATTSQVWLWVLASLALVLLSCALKNYLSYLVSGTVLCPYLCPSLLGREIFDVAPGLDQWFEFQAGIQGELQQAANELFRDPWRLTTAWLIAPLLEETAYRGPLYLLRRHATRLWWWVLGLLLVALFAISHGRTGLALLPLIVLGLCALGLLAATRRFWPVVGLHFLHNFFFSSISLYQSLWAAD